MKNPFLQTDRLLFQKPLASDLEFFKQVYGTEEMMRNLGGAQSDSFIEHRLKEMTITGLGMAMDIASSRLNLRVFVLAR